MGLTGLYWSSTAYPNVNNAYLLAFDSANTYPSNYNARWRGFAVRWGGRKFTRSGGVDLDVGTLRHVGNAGGYWSTVAYADMHKTYYLRLGDAYMHSSYFLARWFGFASRCVAW